MQFPQPVRQGFSKNFLGTASYGRGTVPLPWVGEHKIAHTRKSVLPFREFSQAFGVRSAVLTTSSAGTF